MATFLAVPVTFSDIRTWVRTAATVLNNIGTNVNTLTARPSTATTADYTMAVTDYLVTIDATAGPVTITLPTPSKGRQYAFKRLDSTANAVVLLGSIDGAGSLSLTDQWEAYILSATNEGFLIL